LKNASVLGVLALPPDSETAQRMEQSLFDFYATGKIRVAIDAAYSIEELPTALEKLRQRKVNGKQVLLLNF
ncbi:MAG: zinc-binding dehydrogenase, partial [Pseudomonadales bacterium]